MDALSILVELKLFISVLDLWTKIWNVSVSERLCI